MAKFPFSRSQVSWLTTGLIVTVAIIASSAMTGVIVYRLLTSPKTAPKVANPIRENTLTQVAALGRLEPQGEVINVSASYFLEGAKVEQLLVKLGDKVEAGQVIALLDSRDRLQAAFKRAKTGVRIAQTRLDKIKAGAKAGAIQSQKATIKQLEAELTGQIATQEATIKRIKAELNNAQTECRRYQMLYRNGAISASERDNICLKEDTVNEQLAEAIANRDRTLATLIQQSSQAKATLDEIAEVRPVDIAIATAELEDAQAAVQQAQANLSLVSVRSPKAGQILKIHAFPGEIIGEKGIVELGQTEQMYAIAEVYETEIHHVRIGQKATVISTGFMSKLSGIVDEIGLQIGKKDVLGTDPAADADARVVEVKIRLDADASQKVKSLTNLQVNVTIDISSSLTNSY